MSKPTYAQRTAELEQDFATKPLIRAVNFHSTAASNAAHYDQQLARYAQEFSSVSQAELTEYLITGKWNKSKPGLIVSVFEGYRNSYEVLLPLLEKHNFIGWFWMITSFINAPIADQRTYAGHHLIDMATHEYPDGRYAMTWEELRIIDKKHVIASHTRNHTLLSSLPPDVQYKEIVGSQEDFKKGLGHPVEGFVSLTGPPYGEHNEIDRLIDQAGYKLELSNYRIQRIKA